MLSKQHYCYKIHTLLMKGSDYPPPPSIDNPHYMDYFPFLQENVIPPFMISQKSQSPINRGGWGHTM